MIKEGILAIRKLVRQYLFKIDDRSPLERAIDNGLKIGKNVHIMEGCNIDAGHCFLINIGNNVSLGPNVCVLAHDASMKRELNYVRIAPVRIKDNVFVGAGSIILPGITIGENVIIGAGSVVTHDIPSNVVACGVPAVVCGTYDDFMHKHKEKMAQAHLFDESYKIDVISAEKREKMIAILNKEGVGYII